MVLGVLELLLPPEFPAGLLPPLPGLLGEPPAELPPGWLPGVVPEEVVPDGVPGGEG